MARQTENIPLSSPNPGSTRHLRVHRYGEPGQGPKAYLHSSLHADEWPGLLVLNHLIRMLDDADSEGRISGEIVLLPFANPIGVGQRVNGRLVGRYHLDGGGNFNRGWPDLTDTAAKTVEGKLGDDTDANIQLIRSALVSALDDLPTGTELEELRATLLGFSVDADIVLDLHCDRVATLHIYANRAQQDDAMTLTRDIGSPVLLLEDAPGGGPFDEANHGPWVKLQKKFDLDDVVAQQCFSVTVELRGENDINDQLAERDAEALLRFLMRKGVVSGDPGPLPDALCQATPLDGVDVPKVPGTGVLAWHVKPGDTVTKGDHIADLVDIEADDPTAARTPIHARTSGYMFARKSAVFVKPGDQICKIAGAETLDYRKEGALLAP
jgi:uncharacterized protein